MKTIHNPTWLPKKGNNNMHINILIIDKKNADSNLVCSELVIR